MAMEHYTIEQTEFGCYFGFHTQEFREEEQSLDEPIWCDNNKAWLGPAFYFWLEEEFAHHWGELFKTNTGAYDVYSCYVEDNKILDTTFDKDSYTFWITSIEKAIEWLRDNGKSINLKATHRFLKEKFWDPMGINGIIYDDLPHNNFKTNRTYTLIEPLYYKKRIQIAVFNKELIHRFELEIENESCYKNED